MGPACRRSRTLWLAANALKLGNSSRFIVISRPLLPRAQGVRYDVVLYKEDAHRYTTLPYAAVNRCEKAASATKPCSSFRYLNCTAR